MNRIKIFLPVLALLILGTNPAFAQSPLDSQPKEESKIKTEYETILFPRDNLFKTLLANPKEPRFHASVQRWKTDKSTTTIGSVGFGENIGIVRRERNQDDWNWQVSVQAAVFSIFDLETSSSDLQNSDFIFGIPLEIKKDGWSFRPRIWHQSSHLGDEFLLDLPPSTHVQRENISFESVEILASYEFDDWRIYGGPARIIHTDTDLGRGSWEAGIEYRGPKIGWGEGRFVAAADVHSWQETDWDRDLSFKAGLDFPSPYFKERSVQFLLEYYRGHVPHGQFFDIDVQYFGFSLSFPF